MRPAVFFLILVFITACATSGPYPASSPYFNIPAGTLLHLQQSLTIPPNTGRVYIQYGKVISNKEKQQYYAHCWFLSHKVLDTAQTINPDTFVVTGSQKLEDVIQQESIYRLASLITVRRSYSNTSITALEYTTRLNIHSDKQPDIIQFLCSYWEDPLDAKHLTIAEMQKALGDIVRIELLTEQTP